MQTAFMFKYYLDRIALIDRLIQIKGTGTPRQLAERLGISERTLYETLSLMKERGAPIQYCRVRRSYFYGETGSFSIKFTRENAG